MKRKGASKGGIGKEESQLKERREGKGGRGGVKEERKRGGGVVGREGRARKL